VRAGVCRSTSTLERIVLRSTVAYLLAPVVGAAVPTLLLSLVLPGWFVYIYGVSGLFVAFAASLLLGLPTVLLARSGRALRLPSLLMVAVFAAPALTLFAHCLFGGCFAGPWLSFMFGIVCAVVTAVVLHVLLPRENAL
jgi:hypothetical protein